VEDRQTATLLRNHHLAKRMHDAGWSQFLRILRILSILSILRILSVTAAS
jgi:hypothetical protein